MKIKKLEIVGFKSFVDHTVLNFDHDVTGIVGPNGCGKSNVVDAIKWVMGEQSAQRLRGKAMDDVIFNGSETRGPHGYAEVTITFDNTDGLTPPEYRDYAEISVSRRLDRQGRSDYVINKTPVRLMDVTNLFLGTGVGRRAYSIIEQGRIGFIVSSKPADRRQMLEEAAGITKFKVRKRAAERKMDQTRQNLLRISDIVHELERNLASLKRQAQKAERYRRYRAEVRDLELWVASFKYLDLFQENKVVAAQLGHASARSEGVRLALRIREAEVEAERANVDEVALEVDKAQNRAYELDNRVRLLEGTIQQHLDRLASLREAELIAERELGELTGQRGALAHERDSLAAALADLEKAEREASELLAGENAELERRRASVEEAERAVVNARARVGEAQTRIARAEAVLVGFERRRVEERARLERLHTEGDELAQRKVELEQSQAEHAARLEGLRSGKQQTAARRDEIEAELKVLRAEIHDSDMEVESLREAAAKRGSRLRSLQELAASFEGVGAGVRALMTRFADSDEERRGRGVQGLVADRLECPEELTQALAGALGERLQHVVVDSTEAGLAAIGFLREEERGRATVLPSQPRRVVGAGASAPAGEGVIGRMVDLVGHAPQDTALANHLLGGVFVVEDLETALRVLGEGFTGGQLVTREGEVVGPDGAVTGGSHDDAAAHMLEVQREIRELAEVVERLEANLATAVSRHGELRSGIAQRQAEIDSARSEAHDAEIAIVTVDKDMRALADEQGRVERRRQQVDRDAGELAHKLEQGSDEESAAKAEIEHAHQSEHEASQELAAADGVFRSRRQAVEEQAQRVTEVRVRAAQARERAESDRGAMQRLVRSIEELDTREARLQGDLANGARQQGTVAAHVVLSREELHETVRLAMGAHEEMGAVRAHYDEARQTLGQHEVALKTLRADIDETSAALNQLSLRERELSLALDHLLSNVDERHRVDLRKILCDFHARPLPDAAVTSRISELLRLIERMGEINLMAIEEYEEKAERYDYLTSQQKDLDEALNKLERAIRQMNRESKRMFKEAFVAVNERFKLVFPTLFRGGKAELRLTDPDNILESGIDIVAQPPGKRVGALELMSGGEKALTAVALIFAIFQYKPSPFCLLDEVDAPLDEANIGRFAEAIRQMTDRSQFIVITHSKRTMEFTDVLYGVTMEQPGVSKLVSVELRGEKRPAPSLDDDIAVA